jgi:hypothetical protein
MVNDQLARRGNFAPPATVDHLRDGRIAVCSYSNRSWVPAVLAVHLPRHGLTNPVRSAPAIVAANDLPRFSGHSNVGIRTVFRLDRIPHALEQHEHGFVHLVDVDRAGTEPTVRMDCRPVPS